MKAKQLLLANLLCLGLSAQLPSYLNPNLTYGSVSDIDGNNYATITIGNQVWMAENLRTSKYNNGVVITNIPSQYSSSTLPVIPPGSSTPIYYITTVYHSWYNTRNGVWTNYNNANTSNEWGKLYNGYSIKDNNICPNGWNVPTTQDWNNLINYLGGIDSANIKMRSVGTTYWNSPNNGTNKSGFSAIANGNVTSNKMSYSQGFGSTPPASASFSGQNVWANWWANTEINDSTYNILVISNNEKGITSSAKRNGLSIRCVQSNANGLKQSNALQVNPMNTYPNLIDDILNVEYILNEKENIRVSLINMEGKEIKVFGEEIQNKGFKRIHLDFTDIPAGMYVLKVSGEVFSAHSKIIKK
jgi:uncharacterized protein (TIGR02145 family)